MDWHIGVQMKAHTSLDANAAVLCERSIGFHNGGTGATAAEDDARTTNSGSNWARGASGVGVEFDSVYDGSFFANVTELDYCSPSGFSDPQKKNLDQSSTWCEGLAVTHEVSKVFFLAINFSHFQILRVDQRHLRAGWSMPEVGHRDLQLDLVEL